MIRMMSNYTTRIKRIQRDRTEKGGAGGGVGERERLFFRARFQIFIERSINKVPLKYGIISCKDHEIKKTKPC